MTGAKEGYGRLLGHLEHEVLESLWTSGEASGKEIYERVRRTRDVALTTVLTVLERLTRKGFVEKEKGGSVFIFRPVYTKDEFAREVSGEVLRNIFEISSAGATASFVDMLADAGSEELDRLSAMIEKKKRELKTARGGR